MVITSISSICLSNRYPQGDVTASLTRNASTCREDASYCAPAMKPETHTSEEASSSPMFSVPQSDELALSKEFPPIHFTSVQDLKKRGAALREEVENGGQCQHIAFRQIIEDQFERLQKSRADLGRGITFTWFEDIKTLIIKIPAMPHEKAHLGFERIMTRKAVAIGLDDLEFSSIGSTLYKGQRSAKEADSSWMNQIVRPQKEQFPGVCNIPVSTCHEH